MIARYTAVTAGLLDVVVLVDAVFCTVTDADGMQCGSTSCRLRRHAVWFDVVLLPTACSMVRRRAVADGMQYGSTSCSMVRRRAVAAAVL